jgi:hypothetical protein
MGLGAWVQLLPKWRHLLFLETATKRRLRLGQSSLQHSLRHLLAFEHQGFGKRCFAPLILRQLRTLEWCEVHVGHKPTTLVEHSLALLRNLLAF